MLKWILRVLANRRRKQIQKWANNPIVYQEKNFQYLIKNGRDTLFGKDHHFNDIKTYQDFKKYVPIRDYEGLKPYIERILYGQENVLWKGKPLYFAKTSGTTSGTKYIPITKESMPTHIQAARDAIFLCAYNINDVRFMLGKMMFLSGSPEFDEVKHGIPVGRLSGIVQHHVPKIFLRNRVPSWDTNIIPDWETKVKKIAQETISQDLRLISGIPPWVQMYCEEVYKLTGKKLAEVFPNLSVFVQGGVDYRPYEKVLNEAIGKKLQMIEVYPASEGFIAYQDTMDKEGLLLILDNYIFYEFIPADEVFKENPTRLSLKEVETGVNYAIILNTNAGLWGYNIGDTVRFVSKNPYRIVVTGRIKHFISAFGEHVISEEVNKAMLETAQIFNAEITEFTVAPYLGDRHKELPYHEWFIEFATLPQSLDKFATYLDQKMQNLNSYYKDLRQGNVLQELKIRIVPKDGFIEYMKSIGKLGGQNKLPRLSNDRKIADALMNMFFINAS
ncbi:MAG: GH3 auxin-responsive promoter family protein [Bacteroidia bacterium]|nr:GH3 auxin-responsive promoter family protein [Bacteroidia bacterium]MDW8345425.1 GH3 auxin-responsive promoter family protein [Bacteroidia bacterium]